LKPALASGISFQFEGFTVPKYYFDVKNGHRLADPAGIACVGEAKAKEYGRRIALQTAAEVPTSVSRRVGVRDANGREVAVIPIGESK
jgi:hypothetical protein